MRVRIIEVYSLSNSVGIFVVKSLSGGKLHVVDILRPTTAIAMRMNVTNYVEGTIT